jgi:hypothetical protein
VLAISNCSTFTTFATTQSQATGILSQTAACERTFDGATLLARRRTPNFQNQYTQIVQMPPPDEPGLGLPPPGPPKLPSAPQGQGAPPPDEPRESREYHRAPPDEPPDNNPPSPNR